MNKNISIKLIMLCLTILILSLLTALLLFCDTEQPTEYKYLHLLPLLYIPVSLLFILSIPKKGYQNYGVSIFFAQSIIRCVLTPLFMYIGNYKSTFLQLTEEDVLKAIYLMIYEFLWCYIAIKIALSTYLKESPELKADESLKRSSHKSLAVCVAIISLACVALWLTFPAIRNNYKNVFEIVLSGEKVVPYDYSDYAQVGTLAHSSMTLFIVLFKSARIIVPSYIIIALYKRGANRVHFFLSLILVALQFLFISDIMAITLISSCLLLLLLFSLYKKYRFLLGIMTCIIISISVLFVLGSMYKLSSNWFGFNNIYEYISNVLNSYFTGVCNVASTYRMPDSNKVQILFQTLISAIPFRSTILNFSVNWDTLNTIYTSIPGLGSQIISTVGGGHYLFKELLSPVFSFIFLLVSVRFGKLYLSTNNDWKKIAYLFMCFQSALGVGVYNIPITLSNWIEVGIPILIISHYAGPNSI